MKNFKRFILLTLLLLPSLTQAFNGRLSYNIQYKDMDWLLIHESKASKSKITLQSNGYTFKEILIHSAQNKIYHLDRNKAIYSETPLGSNQRFGDFGKKYDKKYLNDSDLKKTGKSKRIMGFEAKEYKISGKGKNTYFWQAKDLPQIPDFILNIFSPLRDKLPGIKLIYDKEPGSPAYIEQKKMLGLAKNFVMELKKVEEIDIPDEQFKLPKNYKRATGTLNQPLQGGEKRQRSEKRSLRR